MKGRRHEDFVGTRRHSLRGHAPDCAVGAATDRQARPTLAIVDFETTPAGSVLAPPPLGAALAGLMLDRLVASGEFRVLDGRWLKIGRAADGYLNVDGARVYAESTGVDYWSSDR